MSSFLRVAAKTVLILSQLFGCIAVPAETQRPIIAPKISIVVYGRVASQGVTSLSITEPPFEVAFERIKEELGDRYDLSYIQTTAFPCLSALPSYDNGADNLAWWYNKRHQVNHSFIFLTPGGSGVLCDASDGSVHSLADNWNTLAFNTVSGLEIQARIPPFSTSFSFTSVGATGYIENALALAAYYKWSSIFTLWDESSVPSFRALALGLDKGLRRTTILREFCSIKSTPSFDFTQTLWAFGNVSRVMFYYGHAAQLRRLLITAATFNMIGEQYVYVATEMMPAPSLYGNLSWYKGDADDEVARRAFESVLILQSLDAASQTNKTQRYRGELLVEFRKRSLLKYNTTYAPGNDLATVLLDGYITVLLVGQVLHEALENHDDLSDGRGLASRLLNRTFNTADFGEIFVDKNGQRKSSQAVAYFDVVRNVRQIFLVQYASSPGSLKPVNEQIPWPRGAWPSLPRLICGYRGDTCPTSRSPGVWIGSTTGVCVAIILCSCVLLRWMKQFPSGWESSWLLEQQELSFKTQNQMSNATFLRSYMKTLETIRCMGTSLESYSALRESWL
ncbi:hypothetical protein BV898_06961 [Hypsibius exemplaris]|uniref:Receptor ligand binding region domain-containing protein n=1 Tax=Hypsibius exemplaris TaxID=2072580 RepID=A0A1W0WUK8_HYPEX|nr:hypothetical protein BV898_06961 [Hypsibius exemplaris]